MKNRNRKRRLVAKVESMEGRCLLSAAPQFSIKDLGVASTIGGINQLGQVVGMIEPTDGGSSVVALSGQDGSPLKPLVPVPGFDFDISCGIAVNDSSQVLFSAIPGENGSNSPSLYFYSNGRLTSISDSVGHLYSPGNPLNNSGNIVGHLQSNDHAFFYNGTTHDLGTLGGTYSLALGINDSNQIVGSSSTGLGQSSPFHAFFYDGSMRDMGTLGGVFSEAFGINASGQVVGDSTTADGHLHRFISDPNGGALHDLGESYFASINDQGQAVGWQDFFDGTHVIDLNTLIPQNQGFSSINAFAINNSDQVAATGVDMSGRTHALLLTPIPPVAPTITWSNPADITYGTPLSATQLNATASVPGTFTYSVPEGTVLHAGVAQTLTATFTPDDTADYTTVTATALINVNPRPVWVYANPMGNPITKVYGATPPDVTVTYLGQNDGSPFVNGDTPESLGLHVALLLDTILDSSTPVGTYEGGVYVTYNPTNGHPNDYGFNGTGIMVIVLPVPLTVTANSATKVYGAALPTLAVTYSGFVNGDTAASLATQATATTSATSASPVSSYAITAFGATDPNYTIMYESGTLTITPAPLIITANNAQVHYGFMIPPLTGTITGLVNGDTDVATYTTTAVQGSWAGYYPIVPHLTDPNYNITFVNGILTIYWSVPPGGL